MKQTSTKAHIAALFTLVSAGVALWLPEVAAMIGLAAPEMVAIEDAWVKLGAHLAATAGAWLATWLPRNRATMSLLALFALPLLLGACTATPPRDARDALAIAEFSVQGVSETARAAVAAGLIRGDDATAALAQVRHLRTALATARAAVALTAPDAAVHVQALNVTILGLSVFLEARGVTAAGPVAPPQSRLHAPRTPAGLQIRLPAFLASPAPEVTYGRA